MTMRKADDKLYIGGVKSPIRSDKEFGRVVSLSIELDETTHPNLILDGEHNYETFKNAVRDTIKGLNNNEIVLVNCQRGNSRSVCVATAALYDTKDYSLYKSLSKCKRNKETTPNNKMLESLIKYTSKEEN